MKKSELQTMFGSNITVDVGKNTNTNVLVLLRALVNGHYRDVQKCFVLIYVLFRADNVVATYLSGGTYLHHEQTSRQSVLPMFATPSQGALVLGGDASQRYA